MTLESLSDAAFGGFDSISDLNGEQHFVQSGSFPLLEIAMYVGKTLFAQIMDFLPWKTFHRIVARHGGDHRVRTLTCAEHFCILSWGTDLLPERAADAPGTVVLMRLANDRQRTLQEVFVRFAAPEEYTFSKTIVPVKLAQHEGEKLVSRSQAKRLTMRFERFQTVVLDFTGVEEIGQAFADEVSGYSSRRIRGQSCCLST